MTRPEAVPSEFGVAGATAEDLPPLDTPLQYLQERLAERRKSQDRIVKLRDTVARPDLVFTCRVPADASEARQITKAAEAEEKKRDAPPGGLILGAMTVARYCTQVSIDGRDLTEGDGSAFADPALQQVLGVDRAWKAVRALLEDDFAVARLYDELMVQAGAGQSGVQVQEDDGEDPT